VYKFEVFKQAAKYYGKLDKQAQICSLAGLPACDLLNINTQV
jgi:hypothetical protein